MYELSRVLSTNGVECRILPEQVQGSSVSFDTVYFHVYRNTVSMGRCTLSLSPQGYLGIRPTRRPRQKYRLKYGRNRVRR